MARLGKVVERMCRWRGGMRFAQTGRINGRHSNLLITDFVVRGVTCFIFPETVSVNSEAPIKPACPTEQPTCPNSVPRNTLRELTVFVHYREPPEH
jgi:hypothetical protein